MIGSIISAGFSLWGMAEAESAKRKEQIAQVKALVFRQANAAQYAHDLEKQGEQQFANILAKGRKLRGQQIVAQAAQGVVVGSGSAKAANDRVMLLSEADALVALNEAYSKARNVRTESRYDAMETKHKVDAISSQIKQNTIRTAGNIASSFLG